MQLLEYYRKAYRKHGYIKGVMFLLVTIGHKVLERCYVWYIKQFAHIDKSVILFSSIPDYSDNARALAEYMVENGYTKKFKLYFNVVDLAKYENKVDGITFVSCKNEFGSCKLTKLRLMITAGYSMDTHANLLPTRYWKSGQYRVRLWHGCGYKDRNSSDKVGVRRFDIALVPGNLFVKTKAYYWNVAEKYILPIGYPRYNWLKTRDSRAEQLLSSYKTDDKTKVVIWMPTFRNDKEGRLLDTASITQFPLVAEKSQWLDIDRLCKEKNVVLLVKLHRLQPEYDIPFEQITNVIKIDNDSFEKADVQMYKFLALTDALISDYSSVAIDYLIVNRPIAFALQDYEEYKHSRGFVFEDPRIYMPGHHLYHFDNMKNFLLDISEGRDPYVEQRKQMYGKAIYYSDNYCKELLDKIGIYK